MDWNIAVKSMGKFTAAIVVALLVSGCTSTSDKYYKLSQESMKSGNHSAAFDHAVESLEAEIDNEKTQDIFPQTTSSAFDYHLTRVKQCEQQNQWDNAVFHYEEIVAMQSSISSIQNELTAHIEKQKKIKDEDRLRMQQILDISLPDIDAAHKQARNSAAEAHYIQGQSLASSGSYRQAVTEFKTVSQFVPGFKDAFSLAIHYKRLADLADAEHYYKKGKQAAMQEEYRKASEAFSTAVGYVTDFHDAHELAERYRNLADKQDAEQHYTQGHTQADLGHYRAAAGEFQKALTFVNGYKDAANLYNHYTQLANEQDASKHYNNGLYYLDQNRFADAAREFRDANQYVPGFRDATNQAIRAEYAIPPQDYTVVNLVKHEINDHGIQRRWFGNHSNAHFVSWQVQRVAMEKQEGYNRHRKFWRYNIHIEVTGVIQNAAGNHIPVSVTAHEPFFLYRNQSGYWEAEFHHRN